MKTTTSAETHELDLSIIEALERDHDDLKAFIKILKDEDAAYGEKKEAYPLFASLLKSHAKSEEKAFYTPCLKKGELKTDSYEGFEEHAVADALMKKIEASTHNKDQWLARVKVLAELVEHHVKEEEKDFFPKAKKEFKKPAQEDMAEEFVTLRARSQKHPTVDNAGVLSQI